MVHERRFCTGTIFFHGNYQKVVSVSRSIGNHKDADANPIDFSNFDILPVENQDSPKDDNSPEDRPREPRPSEPVVDKDRPREPLKDEELWGEREGCQ